MSPFSPWWQTVRSTKVSLKETGMERWPRPGSSVTNVSPTSCAQAELRAQLPTQQLPHRAELHQKFQSSIKCAVQAARPEHPASPGECSTAFTLQWSKQNSTREIWGSQVWKSIAYLCYQRKANKHPELKLSPSELASNVQPCLSVAAKQPRVGWVWRALLWAWFHTEHSTGASCFAMVSDDLPRPAVLCWQRSPLYCQTTHWLQQLIGLIVCCFILQCVGTAVCTGTALVWHGGNTTYGVRIPLNHAGGCCGGVWSAEHTLRLTVRRQFWKKPRKQKLSSALIVYIHVCLHTAYWTAVSVNMALIRDV